MTEDNKRALFIDGMSNAACTVNVVATDGPAGRAGLTVSAMSSVSADPPTLLICVHEASRAVDIISRNGTFTVNVLNDDQLEISNTFAGRTDFKDKFSKSDWTTLSTGSPVLQNALVVFDCDLASSFQSGSHHIFIGHPRDIRIRESGHPLIYANRAYGRTVPIDDQMLSQKTIKSANARSLGCFTNISAFFGPALIADYQRQHGTLVELHEGRETELRAQLQRQELDALVVYQSSEQGNSTEVRQPLLGMEPAALLPEAHPLARLNSLTLQQLADYPMVCLRNPSGAADYIDSLFGSANLQVPSRKFAPSFEALRGMVAHGLGFAITITKPCSNMSYDGAALIRRPIRGAAASLELALVHRPLGKCTEGTRDFISYCRRYLTARRAL